MWACRCVCLCVSVCFCEWVCYLYMNILCLFYVSYINTWLIKYSIITKNVYFYLNESIFLTAGGWESVIGRLWISLSHRNTDYFWQSFRIKTLIIDSWVSTPVSMSYMPSWSNIMDVCIFCVIPSYYLNCSISLSCYPSFCPNLDLSLYHFFSFSFLFSFTISYSFNITFTYLSLTLPVSLSPLSLCLSLSLREINNF